MTTCDEAIHPTNKIVAVGRRKLYTDTLKLFFSPTVFRETIPKEMIRSKKKTSRNQI